MDIRISEHLKFRMQTRGITQEILMKVYKESDYNYYDIDTKHHISCKKLLVEGKEREFVVVYQKDEKEIVLLTIHPLKSGQRENRIEKGRWKEA